MTRVYTDTKAFDLCAVAVFRNFENVAASNHGTIHTIGNGSQSASNRYMQGKDRVGIF